MNPMDEPIVNISWRAATFVTPKKDPPVQYAVTPGRGAKQLIDLAKGELEGIRR